ncbi:HAD family hydrolase [Microlunatus capsulatus]|uniref:HAD superfamily hydrolase (TIGR01509 family) n=1 Tax=Microlunatus capsulatus TaxID=99117 RepID=A0ABS4Z300_9ACTN|nr:HAD family phosphatase [Microlunatus capsulatus]MBP2415426.1 HAD superfamily hydrolase (TIGR01509 family) [Microlunatus capsulatus]
MSTTTPAAPAAVLWDFDGTLADTEPLWIEAEFELIATLGGTWSEEQADELVGNSLIDSAIYILNAIDRRDVDPAWVVDQLLGRVVGFLAERPMPWRPGALELLTALGRAGVPCGLVSASYRVLLDAALSQLPAGTFAVSVAGDEVTQGKPHPEPYEKACEALGVDARRCVVIEDSVTGARSGNAAGCLVVGVPNRVEIPAAPRRRVVASLTELDAAGVAELLEHADDPD